MLPHAGYSNNSLAQGTVAQNFPALVWDLDLSWSPVAITIKMGYTQLNILHQ